MFVPFFAECCHGWEFVIPGELQSIFGASLGPVVAHDNKGVVTFSLLLSDDSADLRGERSQEILKKLWSIRSADNVFLMTAEALSGVPSEKDGLDFIERLSQRASWGGVALAVLHAVVQWLPPKEDPPSPPSTFVTATPAVSNKAINLETPTFRCTANRFGQHKWTSPEAAGWMGGGLEPVLGWKVDLENFDIQAHAVIVQEKCWMGIALTCRYPHADLFKRNRNILGRTTLKASLAYSLLQVAGPPAFGSVVLDAMCGVGTIPIECSQAFPFRLALGGEIDEDDVQASRKNILAASAKVPAEVAARWDAKRLPLRSNVVDCVLVDMPYGKRCGNHRTNRDSYFQIIREIARVLRPEGKALLLTCEKKLVLGSLEKLPVGLVTLTSTLSVENSGIPCFVFTLQKMSPNTTPQASSSSSQ